jgi:hypothetical protein
MREWPGRPHKNGVALTGMQHLGGLDSTFLDRETPVAPMHAGDPDLFETPASPRRGARPDMHNTSGLNIN